MKRCKLNDVQILVGRGRVEVVPKGKRRMAYEGEKCIDPAKWDQSNLALTFLCLLVTEVMFQVPDTDKVRDAFFKIEEFDDLIGSTILMAEEAWHR